MPNLPPEVLSDEELLAYVGDPSTGLSLEQRYSLYAARFDGSAVPILRPEHARLRRALRDAWTTGVPGELEQFLRPDEPDDAPLRERHLTRHATGLLFDLWDAGVDA